MQPNVLLVVLDSVRARNTSLHGYDFETTPFLSQFADEHATQYTQARAPAATSLTSHASIFTGLSVPEHGLKTTDAKLDPGHTVFEKLRSAGYETAIFSENTWITDVAVGLKDGFDTIEGPRNLPFPEAVDPKSFVAEAGRGQYVDYIKASIASSQPVRSLTNGLATKLAWDFPWLLPDSLQASTAAGVYADLFLEWEREQEGPWAACLNFMDAHIPYEPATQFDRWGGPDARSIQDNLSDLEWVFLGGQEPWWKRRALEGLYDGAIAQMDTQIRRIVQKLDERGALDDTLVVVTSDHGEGFGEPDEIRDVRVAEHGVSISEVVFHVPLLVKYPGQSEGRTVDEPVSLARFPDAVEVATEGGRDNAEAFVTDGPVRVSAAGLDTALKERASEYVTDFEPFTATARAVYESEDGLITKDMTWRDRAQRIVIRDAHTSYNVEEDDVSIQDRVATAFASIDDAGVREGTGGVDEMSDTTRQRLEDLGYV